VALGIYHTAATGPEVVKTVTMEEVTQEDLGGSKANNESNRTVE
jgi:acetyl-CoA carboxylase carboxyltransferase component